MFWSMFTVHTEEDGLKQCFTVNYFFNYDAGLQHAAEAGAGREAAGRADSGLLPPLAEGAHAARRGAAGRLPGQAGQGQRLL